MPECVAGIASSAGCPERAVPGEVNCCKHLFPCDGSWRLGCPAVGFQITAEGTAFVGNVRLSEVPHFDAVISEWGMTPSCRTGAGERVHPQGDGMSPEVTVSGLGSGRRWVPLFRCELGHPAAKGFQGSPFDASERVTA
jgi:hypothetical protein